MIPAWKLRRELRRLIDQIVSLPALIHEPIRQSRYDATLRKALELRDGGAPAAEKICVFLVYQPDAVPPSVLLTCAWLRSRGYATLLVANGGLPEAAMAQLHGLVWKVLSRPNFGYDFGGYRDGLLQVAAMGLHPERLVILNDSIWLPMHDRTCPLTLAEAIPDAITGLLMHTRRGIDQPDAEGMIESYFYSVPRKVLADAAFWQFWQSLRLSNVKARVIHRGERGFSKAMHAAGIPLAALSSRRMFLARIAAQDAAFLRLTLQHAAYIDPPLAAEGTALLAGYCADDAWRERALRHIEATVMRRRFNGSFYVAADRLGLTNFMKKNRGALFVPMRSAALRAIECGDLPCPDATIVDEITQLDR